VASTPPSPALSGFSACRMTRMVCSVIFDSSGHSRTSSVACEIHGIGDIRIERRTIMMMHKFRIAGQGERGPYGH
jgi:hypothetical protein